MQSRESLPILTKERNLLTIWEEAVPREVKGGITVYDKVLKVRIMAVGDQGDTVYEVEREYAQDHPNPIHGKIRRNEVHYARFREHIERWRKEGEGMVVDGTPIENWPLSGDVRRVALLKHLGIHSVETLSTIGDTVIAKIGPGARELAQKAKDWLAQQKDAAFAADVSEKNRRLEERLEAMQAQLDEMGEAMEALPQEQKVVVQEAIKRRRGRPPKAAA